MKEPKGFVETIAASGGIWAGFEAPEVKTLVFESLRKARRSIQISIFSLGEKNEEMKEFFQIIEDKTKAGRSVQFLINDMEGELVGKFSKNKLNRLMKYENFDQVTRSITMDMNFNDSETVWSVLPKLLLKTEAGDRKVRLLGVTVSNLSTDSSKPEYKQSDLSF